MSTPIIITGGAGFIGSNFIVRWLATEQSPVINLDKLTYAGNLASLENVENDSRYRFVQGDICDLALIAGLLQAHQPGAIVHFAAETHVDRSIRCADEFIRTNVQGTFHLLQAALQYWSELPAARKDEFRFAHVSTDEVYGSLAPSDPAFSETTPYAPNSPYAASKAASDHLVRAYHHTYGLPTLTTHCSNNYGPYQFPEKLIPLMILNAVTGKSLPVYGDGANVRDWLYVIDHCDAVRKILRHGRPGETYNIGGNSERRNLDVVHEICAALAELRPGPNYKSRISFVKDRPGHDRRYAIDSSKLRNQLGWEPVETFSSGLRKTVEWYLANERWLSLVASGQYRDWIKLHYQQTAH